jgi:5'-3' exonuclease
MNKDFKSILDNIKAATKEDLKPKVLLVDSMNTFLRSFAVINHMNPHGHHIGGLTGFLKSLGFAIRHINPTRVILVFDGPGSTINKKNLYSDYKGNRNLTRITNWEGFESQDDESESIVNQMRRLMYYLQCLPVDVTIIDRLEADDIIGYIASKYNGDVTIMSSDKDFLQLVNKKVTVYSPIKKVFYTPKTVKEEYGVSAENYINMKILLGDSSDNVPGVKGLGAKKLIKFFPELVEDEKVSLDFIIDKSFKALENTKGLLYENVYNFRHQLKINEQLMDLSNPNISDESKEEIDLMLSNPKSSLNKSDFLSMYSEDNLGNSIPNVENWLISIFTYLCTSKK